MSLAAQADALQHAWVLPFEVVDLTPELDRFTPAIVADDGTLYVSTGVPGPAEIEPEAGPVGSPVGRSFAYVVAARIGGRQHFLASEPWAAPAAEAHLAETDDRDCAWLVRVESERGPDDCRTLTLRGPEPILPRRVAEGPAAVLVDLGMVLTRFDRALFELHFQSVFGQPVPPPALDLLENLRQPLERGELLADAFLDRVLEPLGLIRPDREAFLRVWSSIFTVKRSTGALMRRIAARPNVELVVASNIDPIRLRFARTDLGLDDLCALVSASCQDGVNSKADDASIWLRARELATARLGTEPEAVVAIDDIRRYLEIAIAANAITHPIHYRHYAQCRYELGVAGLYVPLERASLLEA